MVSQYLCKILACLGGLLVCSGDLDKLVKCGDRDTIASASGRFSSSSLIEGSANDGPISISA